MKRGPVAAFVLVVAILASSATMADAREPSFLPASRSPLHLKGSPIAVGSIDVGGAETGLAVGTHRPGAIQTFSNPADGPVRFQSKTPIPGDPLTFDIDGGQYDRSPFVSLDRFTGDISAFTLESSGLRKEPSLRVTTGGSPSGVLALSGVFLDGILPENPFVAVTDGMADNLTLVTRDRLGNDRIASRVEVGDHPVSIAAFNYGMFLFVVNRDSDDVSVLQFDFNETTDHPGYKVVDTVPVGTRPTSATFVSSKGIEEVVITNSGSDSVSVLRRTGSDPNDWSEFQHFEVGQTPVAATTFGRGSDTQTDVAVANRGSDDVSILSREDGRLVRRDRIAVGDQPVAITPGGFNPYFNDDLAVANAGDNTVSLLLRNETSGTCLGHNAKLRTFTTGDDSIYSGNNPEQIYLLEGNDRLAARRGGDCAWGGLGRDDIGGEGGNDFLNGGADVDYLAGGADNDYLEGGPGNDYISGNNGRDTLKGGTGNDLISSSDRQRDRVRCGDGEDVVRADRKDVVSGDCETVRRD